LHVPTETTVFDLLGPHIALDACYSSGKRAEEHAVTCQPDTRTKILDIIGRWVNGTGHPVCWLHGPAGTGKSTIAHTVAERCEKSGQLAGTFFFSRKKGDREDINKLVPTLAYQIAESIPSLQARMKQVLEDNRTLFSQTIQRQFSKLIAEPLMNIRVLKRSIVVIDGLDECAARDRIAAFIGLLGEMMNGRTIPLRFLLTSRPEHDIEVAFRSHINSDTALWLALEDSRDDVRLYLRTDLLQIRQKFAEVMKNKPSQWPSESVLDNLVKKSEGLFIYARTAVQYIGDGKGSPQIKLQRVLTMHKGLDPLYTQVITDAQEFEHFDTIMGSLMYLREPLTVRDLSKLLGLDVSEIRMALDGCHSILVIPEYDYESVRPYHASLRDFLISHERSGSLFCAPIKFHHTLLFQCLKNITNALANADLVLEYACLAWVHHGSLLLSEENASLLFNSPFHGNEPEVEQIDLKWLEYWMAEALVWAPLQDLKSDLPSATVS
jgi:NACHT domain